jgi:methyl-accepting chemotaxis protein
VILLTSASNKQGGLKMDEPKTTYKRKNYFIEKGFQTKFILKFCILVLIGGLLTIGILYFMAAKSTTVAIINSRVVVRTTADFILPILIQTVLVVTIMVSLATIIVTLLVSHKIAGPLYRFKKALKDLENGNFSSDFHIRHFDQLQDLAVAFDSMVKKMRQGLTEIKTHFISLKERLYAISEHEVSEYNRHIINELKKIAEELNRTLQQFKV